MDKPKIKRMRARINELLEPMQEEFGVTIGAGNARYGQTDVTISVKFEENDTRAKEVKQKEFAQLARMYDLPEDCLGKTFKDFGGTEYVITDINFRRPKYPVSAKQKKGGGMYKFPAKQVKACLLMME